jgi:hypothetical protein
MIIDDHRENDLGFSFRATKDGDVLISRGGSLVTRLRGARAREFLDKARELSPVEQQHLMARETGNYRRGNERRAGQHPRNSADPRR